MKSPDSKYNNSNVKRLKIDPNKKLTCKLKCACKDSKYNKKDALKVVSET